MAFRGWDLEVAYVLLQELETKLSNLGYHVALPNGRRMATLELFVFPAVQEKDRGEITNAFRSNELHLVEKKSLAKTKKFGQMNFREKEVWGHGRGKSERRVEVFIQAV